MAETSAPPSLSSGLTRAEQQQDLHAQVLVVGDLQAHKLAGDLQHQLALVRHVGQLHPLPGGDQSEHRINGWRVLHSGNRVFKISFMSKSQSLSSRILN